MTDTPQQTPPDWYPDPLGRHELRYWDGSEWSEHVSSHGRTRVVASSLAVDTALKQDKRGFG